MICGLLLVLGVVSLPAGAAGFDEDYEEEDKPWQEIAAKLPAYPSGSKWLQYDAGPTARMAFAVDEDTLTVGADGVVRYVLQVTSPQGAETITFEGVRCNTQEYRVYAYGMPDKRWVKASQNRWQKIKPVGSTAFRQPLWEEFFCPGTDIVKTPEIAIRGLKLRYNPLGKTKTGRPGDY